MPFVVDASVAIQWYVEEPLSLIARQLPRLGEPLYAPDLYLAEMGNIAWKLAMRGEITTAHARTIGEVLPRGMPTLLASQTFLADALDLSLGLQHPLYDCLYLACARHVAGRMVTVDGRLLAAVKGTEADPLVCHLRDVVSA
jgi:predicted nucleic acid-binding protein